MAPKPPHRSERPGEAVALLDPSVRQPGEAVAFPGVLNSRAQWVPSSMWSISRRIS